MGGLQYNIDSYTRLLLLAKLWGDMHVLYENNIKHYFNPYTLNLEPISSDQFQPKNISESGGGDVFDLIGKCNEDYAFIANEPYQSIKNTTKYLSRLVQNYQATLDKVDYAQDFLNKHHSYFPLDNNPSVEILHNNAGISKKMGTGTWTCIKFTIYNICNGNYFYEDGTEKYFAQVASSNPFFNDCL